MKKVKQLSFCACGLHYPHTGKHAPKVLSGIKGPKIGKPARKKSAK